MIKYILSRNDEVGYFIGMNERFPAYSKDIHRAVLFDFEESAIQANNSFSYYKEYYKPIKIEINYKILEE